MRRNNIRLIIALGTISIFGIVVVQFYWLRKTWGINEKRMHQSIQIALKNVAEKIFAYNEHDLPIHNPVSQLSSSYFVVNINDEIDANVLEHFLQTEFDLLNITLDYEYAIYDCANDEMVYGDYISPYSDNIITQKEKQLPKYSEFIYYFGINFPNKKNYLIEGMNLWIAFSGVLLVAIIFFSYAMFTILQQKRLSELQKDFINNMTHEFKTPISTINISADVILNSEIEKNPQRLKNYGGIIKQQVNRLNEQVEKVLQIARIEKRSFSLNVEEINLHELINTIAPSFYSNIKKDEGELRLKLNAQFHQIVADKLHLSNILYNLIDNALKYCNEKVSIQIITKNRRGSIILEIRDNGIGIKKEHQKKVFDKFFRVPTGNLHDVKGFGLGLYYVKNICENHKWNITLESEFGKGTVFRIFMPIKKL